MDNGRIIALNNDALRNPNPNNIPAYSPATGINAVAISFTSLTGVPTTCIVAAHAININNATTPVNIGPSIDSALEYLSSSLLTPFSTTDDCR